MGLKRGIAHLVPILLIAILVIIIPLLIVKFVFKKKLPFVGSKEPNVALKTEYKNPFDKKTQYVNPFGEFKNPLVSLNK